MVEALTGGPRRFDELLVEVQRQTGASEATIRRWGRPLCDVVKRGQPGDPGACWLWSLKPKIPAIGPKITNTAGTATSSPKMLRTRGPSGSTLEMPPTAAQSTVREASPEIIETNTLSLLDEAERSESNAHQRRLRSRRRTTSERQAVIDAFGEGLPRERLDTITLTTPRGHPAATSVRALAEAVAWYRGGLWLTPHAAGEDEHEHHHGLLVGLDSQRLILAWVRLTGGACDQQCTADAYDPPGWLNYCRRMPGFDPSCVIATGRLLAPWTWALGRVGYALPSMPAAVPEVEVMAALAALRDSESTEP